MIVVEQGTVKGKKKVMTTLTRRVTANNDPHTV